MSFFKGLPNTINKDPLPRIRFIRTFTSHNKNILITTMKGFKAFCSTVIIVIEFIESEMTDIQMLVCFR